jgi:hypothetical protein
MIIIIKIIDFNKKGKRKCGMYLHRGILFSHKKTLCNLQKNDETKDHHG